MPDTSKEGGGNTSFFLLSNVNSSFSNLARIPKVIDWTDVKGFKYAGIELMDDIYIEKVR